MNSKNSQPIWIRISIEGGLERKAEARGDSDVEQDLQAERSSGEVGAGGA